MDRNDRILLIALVILIALSLPVWAIIAGAFDAPSQTGWIYNWQSSALVSSFSASSIQPAIGSGVPSGVGFGRRSPFSLRRDTLCPVRLKKKPRGLGPGLLCARR
jgi:hypothetical protein